MPRARLPKTKKSVAKRFKISAGGKVVRHRAGRRHLMSSKSAKRGRYLRKPVVVHETDAHRVKQTLPFHH